MRRASAGSDCAICSGRHKRLATLCDCLFDQAHIDALGTLWWTMSQAGGFDLINLPQVRPDAQCRPFLEAQTRFGSLEPGERQVRCLRIDNRWPSAHASFRSLNKKMRNNHTRGKRILSELGGDVAFEAVEPGRPIDDMLDTMVQWKLAWLRPPIPQRLCSAGSIRCPRPDRRRVERRNCKIVPADLWRKMCAASFNFAQGGIQAYLPPMIETTSAPRRQRSSSSSIHSGPSTAGSASWTSFAATSRSVPPGQRRNRDQQLQWNPDTDGSGGPFRAPMARCQRHRRDVVPSKAPELEEVAD